MGFPASERMSLQEICEGTRAAHRNDAPFYVSEKNSGATNLTGSRKNTADDPRGGPPSTATYLNARRGVVNSPDG